MTRFSTGSVRFRVTRLATGIVAGLLVFGAVALVVVHAVTLTAGIDTNLRQRADGLSQQFALSGLPDGLPGSDDDDAAQLVARDGTPVAWSTNLTGAEPIAPDPGPNEHVEQRTLTAVENDTFRVLSRRVDVQGEAYVLHVAAASDDVSDSVGALALSLAVAVPVAVVLLALVVWWLVGKALQPVEAIRAEVASIGADELDRRVPVPPDDDEIGALARTMNDMLQRLQSGVAKQQAFVADASHELRSPLTRIRSALEVDRAHPTDADLAATQRQVLEEAIEMEALLEDLLFLARSDAGTRTAHHGSIDLDDLVFEEVANRKHADLPPIDVSAVSAAQVRGDRSQLARAIRNLMDNALRHAHAGVIVSLHEDGGEAVLSITDDGPGVPDGERERIFERFARADEDRTRATGGTGLGLAITADIVGRHGGSVRVDPDHRDGARFEIRLPASTA